MQAGSLHSDFAYHTPQSGMFTSRRLTSSLLLAAGLALVFTGFTAALGFTLPGLVATVTAIAALLFAGATWFGAAEPAPPAGPPASCLVFDRARRIVAGGPVGEPVTAGFSELLRAEIDRQCAAALAGASVRFPCLQNGQLVLFEALPVRDADGAVSYGLLVCGAADAPLVAPRP